VAELRKQMDRMAASVSRSTLMASAHTLDPELMSAFAALLESDLDPGLAHSILDRVRAEGVPATHDRLRLAVSAELAGRFTCESQLGTPVAGPRIVALVGPCGAGKTTTLVKLAARFGFSTRRPTHILCADTQRIGASEQLRSCAAILGVAFQVVESARALEQTLEELRHKDLILIDTPGHGPHDIDASADLAAMLSSRDDIDTHLVLSASMRSADLSRVVDRFEVFRPRKLLFTRLDETVSYGPLVNEAVRTAKAVSFLAAGQRIPEDLEPATKEGILQLILAPGGGA
jgi:flagellar biosynthesis protein FlhF